MLKSETLACLKTNETIRRINHLRSSPELRNPETAIVFSSIHLDTAWGRLARIIRAVKVHTRNNQQR